MTALSSWSDMKAALHAKDDRIAELERALQAGLTTMPPQPPPPVVTPKLDGEYIAPDLESARKLIALVHAAYPNLRPPEAGRGQFERDHLRL